MKAILTLSVFSFFVGLSGFSQTGEPTANTLTYYPQIPAVNTYKVVSNTSGKEIPTSILEYINYHRMAEVNVTWKPISTIELLIFPIGFTNETEFEHESH